MTEPTQAPVPGMRDRIRAAVKGDILAAARARLATDGAAALSLRAVARDLGMVSSAIYRYVPSRDALLTELIIEAYDDLGSAVEAAEAGADQADYIGRWLAVGQAMRTWATAHPHEWALVYGSPVPGYAAPEDTIAPAIRVPLVLGRLLSQAISVGAVSNRDAVAAPLAADLPARVAFRPEPPAELILRGVMAWTYLLGSVSAQLFGQRHRVVADDAFERVYEAELQLMAEFVGFTAALGSGPAEA